MNLVVIKRNLLGEETWRYTGRLLRQDGTAVILEALFNRPDTPFMDMLIRNGDRFVETFYTDRWYNIFEMHDRDDDRIKGWYCNIGYPAVWDADAQLSYIDLALDLWVAPDGRQVVLDEDEFAALGLDAKTGLRARAALEELRKLFEEGSRPASG
jgi:uncharacterized protein